MNSSFGRSSLTRGMGSCQCEGSSGVWNTMKWAIFDNARPNSTQNDWHSSSGVDRTMWPICSFPSTCETKKNSNPHLLLGQIGPVKLIIEVPGAWLLRQAATSSFEINEIAPSAQRGHNKGWWTKLLRKLKDQFQSALVAGKSTKCVGIDVEEENESPRDVMNSNSRRESGLLNCPDNGYPWPVNFR